MVVTMVYMVRCMNSSIPIILKQVSLLLLLPMRLRMHIFSRQSSVIPTGSANFSLLLLFRITLSVWVVVQKRPTIMCQWVLCLTQDGIRRVLLSVTHLMQMLLIAFWITFHLTWLVVLLTVSRRLQVLLRRMLMLFLVMLSVISISTHIHTLWTPLVHYLHMSITKQTMPHSISWMSWNRTILIWMLLMLSSRHSSTILLSKDLIFLL